MAIGKPPGPLAIAIVIAAVILEELAGGKHLLEDKCAID
jgi:hypothetical protein